MPCQLCNMKFAKQYSIYCELCITIHSSYAIAKYNLERILHPKLFNDKFKLDIYGQYLK